MNKRIVELANKAGFSANTDAEKFEKFAEFLVKECLSIADKHGAYNVMDSIIDHFGVE